MSPFYMNAKNLHKILKIALLASKGGTRDYPIHFELDPNELRILATNGAWMTIYRHDVRGLPEGHIVLTALQCKSLLKDFGTENSGFVCVDFDKREIGGQGSTDDQPMVWRHFEAAGTRTDMPAYMGYNVNYLESICKAFKLAGAEGGLEFEVTTTRGTRIRSRDQCPLTVILMPIESPSVYGATPEEKPKLEARLASFAGKVRNLNTDASDGAHIASIMQEAALLRAVLEASIAVVDERRIEAGNAFRQALEVA